MLSAMLSVAAVLLVNFLLLGTTIVTINHSLGGSTTFGDLGPQTIYYTIDLDSENLASTTNRDLGTRMKMKQMLYPDYLRLVKQFLSKDCSTHELPGECELIQQHGRVYDRVGGIDAWHMYLVELGFKLEDLVKGDMPLKEWCNDYTFHPTNNIIFYDAVFVNEMSGNIVAAADAEAVKMADDKGLEVDTQDMLTVAH